MIYPSLEIIIPEPITSLADRLLNNLPSLFFLELILTTAGDAFNIASP
jgi:hypothetical protein